MSYLNEFNRPDLNQGHYGLLDQIGVVRTPVAGPSWTGYSSGYDFAYCPSDGLLYTGNAGLSTVMLTNPNTNTIVKTITVAATPTFLEYNPSNNYMYVTNNSGTAMAINPATGTVVATITLSTGPLNIAYCPSNTSMYASNNQTTTVMVINASNVVTATIAIGSNPAGITYCPTNNSIYVNNAAGGTTRVINSANTVVATIAVSASVTLESIVYCPTNNMIYTADQSTTAPGNRVYAINPATNTVVSTITVTGGPSSLSYNPVTDLIYTGGVSLALVYVISPKTNTVVATLTNSAVIQTMKYCPSVDRMYSIGGSTGQVFT